MVAAAQRFSELNAGVEIAWEKRSLQAFADQPIDSLARSCDLLVLDHPWAGFAFAAGELALMVNWFGFAAMCEVVAEPRVKGKVDIAPIPHAPGASPASLNCYWLYAVAAGSPHQATARDFIRFAVNAENDRLLTLEEGIGCRKSTWRDAAVNRTVPYYHRLEALHGHVRRLPRQANWAQLAGVIDHLVLKAINTDRPVEEILREAQNEIRRKESSTKS